MTNISVFSCLFPAIAFHLNILTTPIYRNFIEIYKWYQLQMDKVGKLTPLQLNRALCQGQWLSTTGKGWIILFTALSTLTYYSEPEYTIQSGSVYLSFSQTPLFKCPTSTLNLLCLMIKVIIFYFICLFSSIHSMNKETRFPNQACILHNIFLPYVYSPYIKLLNKSKDNSYLLKTILLTQKLPY